MRERYLEAFDAVRIDCLNGDKYKTGKTTPESRPNPQHLSTPEDPVGIQVGTVFRRLCERRHRIGASGPNRLSSATCGVKQTQPETARIVFPDLRLLRQ